MSRAGFEGSYLGAKDRISPAAVMECKICWTVYDPAAGDDSRQIDPGTAFTALPEDWTCPGCGAPAEQFMVRHDPGSAEAATRARIADQTARLVADFREVYHEKMRDLPLCNPSLHVEAVGFRPWGDGALGVLVAPWFMNLILLPGEEAWPDLTPGTHETVSFPSGEYDFLHNIRPGVGAYKACSLFSPMGDFASQRTAVEVAEAVMGALFDDANRAETDRAAEIRAAREAELAPPPAPLPEAPSRRAFLTAGLARGEG